MFLSVLDLYFMNGISFWLRTFLGSVEIISINSRVGIGLVSFLHACHFSAVIYLSQLNDMESKGAIMPHLVTLSLSGPHSIALD